MTQDYYLDDETSTPGVRFLNIDPLKFNLVLFSLLILFALHLLLPRGFRKHYFNSYPKRYSWQARSRSRRQSSGQYTQGASFRNSTGYNVGGGGGSSTVGSVANYSTATGGTYGTATTIQSAARQQQQGGGTRSVATGSTSQSGGTGGGPILDMQHNDEIVISAAMQQLRDPGVLIVAHGSRGKPKMVRLQLTENAITWRTETTKPSKSSKDGKSTTTKVGKLHQVPLSHIMYVDVGKQTTALRRVENASVSEALCFSLLTKEGSLDLEANSPRERDALVSCFSLVLDEVHAQNWRDSLSTSNINNMPSSFDEYDNNNNNNNNQGGGTGGGGRLSSSEPRGQAVV